MKDRTMNDSALLERIDALTTAVQILARVQGTRLTRAQLCERLGIHRNTLRAYSADRSFPKPDVSGKWLLSDVLEWECQR